MVVMYEKYDGEWALPGAIAGIFVSLVFALIVWRLAPSISHIIWKKSESSKTIPNPTLDDIQAAVFSAIGLFVLVNTLPHISQYLILVNQTSSPFQAQSSLEFKAKIELATLTIKFAIGVVLLFGSKGLVNLIKKVRNLGLEKQD
jgi:hypothetical protein